MENIELKEFVFKLIDRVEELEEVSLWERSSNIKQDETLLKNEMSELRKIADSYFIQLKEENT